MKVHFAIKATAWWLLLFLAFPWFIKFAEKYLVWVYS